MRLLINNKPHTIYSSMLMTTTQTQHYFVEKTKKCMSHNILSHYRNTSSKLFFTIIKIALLITRLCWTIRNWVSATLVQSSSLFAKRMSVIIRDWKEIAFLSIFHCAVGTKIDCVIMIQACGCIHRILDLARSRCHAILITKCHVIH